MEQSNRILLGRAIIEAFAHKFDGELAMSGESAACTPQHTHFMEKHIRNQARKERRKASGKWIVAVIVAAALLLTAIAVGAYRNEIKAFFEKIYEEYIHLSFNEGEQVPENEELRERYTLGYVPEGYTLQRAESEEAANYSEWWNEAGEYLVFKQRVLQGADVRLDGESGETTIIQWGEYEIYCRTHETNACTYIWNDGEYAYTLVASKTLTEETLILILGGIQKAP